MTSLHKQCQSIRLYPSRSTPGRPRRPFCDLLDDLFKYWMVNWAHAYAQAYYRTLEEIPRYGEPPNDHFHDVFLEVSSAYHGFFLIVTQNAREFHNRRRVYRFMDDRAVMKTFPRSRTSNSNHPVSQTPLYHSSALCRDHRDITAMYQTTCHVDSPPTCTHRTETLCGGGGKEAA